MANTRKGVLKGRKISGLHSTYTPESERVILAVKPLTSVSKIVLGPIACVPPGSCRIKCLPKPAGLKVMVRGVNSVQTLFVYTTAPDDVTNVLLDLFKEK